MAHSQHMYPFPPPPSLQPRLIDYLADIGKGLAVGLVGILLSTSVGVGIAFSLNPHHSSSQQNQTTLDAVAKISPSIVNINTRILSSSGPESAAGTGIILTTNGEILTNNHVVNHSTSIAVSVANHTDPFIADVLGVDPTSDVALIKLRNASFLTPAALADSSKVAVGDKVIALGNALGRGGAPSSTAGTITGLNRSITASDGFGVEMLTGMLETDATIASGESGGAVINTKGEVLGMITAGVRQGANSQISRIGYAVPANKALTVIKAIRSGKPSPSIILGQVGYMGISVSNLTPDDISSLGLKTSFGVLITQVSPNSPALKAGVSANSALTQINQTAIDSVEKLTSIMHTHKPGDKISVSWEDSLGVHSSTMTLTSGPAV